MLALSVLLMISVAKGPALLPFVDEGTGKSATRVSSAFVQAAQEAALIFKSPKQIETELGFALKPSVQDCKGEIVCLSQIGGTIGATQIMAASVRGDRVTLQVISVADAALIRKIEFSVGDDARSVLHACKDRVFEAFGIMRTGDLLLSGVPGDALVTIDGLAVDAAPKIALKPGYRALKVLGNEGEPFVKELYVRPGEQQSVKVNLLPGTPIPALVALKAPKKEPVLEEVPLVAVAPKKPDPSSAPVAEPKLVEIEKKPKKKVARAAPPALPASQPTQIKEIVASPVADPTVVTMEKLSPVVRVRPVRIGWIVTGSLTVGAVVTAGVFSVLQAQTGASANAEPVQLRAASLLDAANIQTDAANALWIATGVLGAATVALLIVDLSTEKKQAVSLQLSPSRITLSGSF